MDLASTQTLVLVTVFATRGIHMAAIPLADVGALLFAVLAATAVLDLVKAPLLAGIRSGTVPISMAAP